MNLVGIDHVSFGSGVHYCLGDWLGRRQSQIAIRSFIERYPTVTLPDQEFTWVLVTFGLALIGAIALGIWATRVRTLTGKYPREVVLAGLAGVGFAFTENILYFGTSLAESGDGSFIFFLRGIMSPLTHAIFTAVGIGEGSSGAGFGGAATGMTVIRPPLSFARVRKRLPCTPVESDSLLFVFFDQNVPWR